MTDIQTTKQFIVERLAYIKSIPKQSYTAMQLYGNYLDRAQRKADTVYYQNLRLHEKRLKYDLAVIENYLATSTGLPVVDGAPLIPAPTSLWASIPLPKKILTRTSSRPRTMRRIR